MKPRVPRSLAYLLAAAFLYASFLIGADLYDSYGSVYGRWVLSRGELALRLYLLLFIAPAIILLAAALAEIRGEQFAVRFEDLRRPAGRLAPIALALAVLCLVMLVRIHVLRHSEITDDENVYHFEARLIASGRLYMESLPPAIRPFFDNQFVVNDGRWYGLYFVGHPAVLAVFMKVGLVEWTGAVEAALTLLLAMAIAGRVFGERAAILTGALLAVSPFFIFVSATHLSQPTSMLFLALFIYSSLRIEDSPVAMRWWVLAAIALVAAIFTRPQSGVMLSLSFMTRVALLASQRKLRPGWTAPVVSLAILLAGAAAFLGVNHALTGSVFRTGYQAYMAQGHAWLFPFGPFHTVREISQSLTHLNFWLLGWPISLALVPFFHRSGRAWTLATIPIIALLWYGLVAIPTVVAVGPVYYAESIVPLVVLTASGLERTIAWAHMHLGNGRLTQTLISIPIAATLACLLAFVPFEAVSLRLMADITQAPYDLVESRGLQNALVFVRSLPATTLAPGSWALVHRNNSPGLRDPVLFVRDLGTERNKDLMRYLPDRTAYLMQMKATELVLLPLER
jgi:dolichyl-phosphate-mannose-protein mannosyltransferase